MSRAAFSILVFGIYLLVLALALIASPNTLLTLLGIAPASEPWIRVAGVVLLSMAAYYLAAARVDATSFFRWSTIARPLLFAGLTALAVLRLADARVMLFGLPELIGAVWTRWALMRDRRA